MQLIMFHYLDDTGEALQNTLYMYVWPVFLLYVLIKKLYNRKK